ncbi:MAG: SDR family NAD(P)-dependent oxidoreductase [Betaproteobacteria bacterium]|nr:SDR family NAD(P)-dependent oxidoreductase [Betaproteobacteria bacterium]
MHSFRLPDTYAPAADCLRDRVVMVTGAGQGLGRAVALACAQHGAHVVLHGRRQKKLDAVYDEIVASGGPEPALFALDLAKATDADFQATAAAIGAQLSRLDALVHCAVHVDQLRPLDDETVDRWLSMLRVNLVAAAALNRACRPLLEASPSASVVLTVESHALSPSMFWGSFALSKQALLSLVAVQAQEWRVFSNLRINALLPGPVATPQRNRTHPAEDASTLPTPDSLAPGYLYLLDPAGAPVSGGLLDMRAGPASADMPAA